MKTPQLVIAVPTYGGIPSNFYDFTIELISTLQGSGIEFSFLLNHGDSLVTRARNLLISRFYHRSKVNDYTHFLFLDSDVSTDPKNIVKLVQITEQMDIDVVGAVVPLKAFKDPVLKEPDRFRLTYDNKLNFLEKDSSLVKVDFLTTGMILMTKKVIDDLIDKAIKDDDWYHCDNFEKEIVYDVFKLGIVRKEVDGEEFRHHLSEDWYLCKVLNELGYDVIADLSIDVGHMGSHEYRFLDRVEVEKAVKSRIQDKEES